MIMLASSEHRKHAAWPRSSGVENRPKGMVARNLSRISGVSSPINVASNGVSPATGARAFTRMFDWASSAAMDLVAVMSQPLLALYQVSPGRGLKPAVEALFHHRHHVATGQLYGFCVDVQYAVELGFVEFFKALRQVADAGVVDEDVDMPERVAGRFD